MKRLVAVSLVVLGALAIPACSQPPTDSTSMRVKDDDALLAAASEASTATPVAIVGYELTFRLDRAPDGNSQTDVARIVVTKGGELLGLPPEEFFTNARTMDTLEPATERLIPEADSERTVRQTAIELARTIVAEQGGGKFRDVEPFVRRYVIDDANGNWFYIRPDGTGYEAAPVLVPYE